MDTVDAGVRPLEGDILIVEDSLDSLRLLANILRDAGYQVRPASDGELALRSIRAKAPALVLLDVKMPAVDGFEVCRRLKADAATRDIPIIFLTALSDTADQAHGFELGAIDYISKPFHSQEVLARIKAHLGLAAATHAFKTTNLQLREANRQLMEEVAKRKQTEEVLRESKERLEGIYASVGDGIVTADTAQHIVLFNSTAEKMFGLPAVQAIGRPLGALLPERFRFKHAADIHRFDVAGVTSRAMGAHRLVYGIRADGSEFPVEASISQSGSAANKLFTVVLRDVTERIKAEQMREQLMQQLELLSNRLANAHEEERRKIVYELHEQLGQEITALQMFLQMAEDGRSGAQLHHDEARHVATQALERVRKLVEELTPTSLEGLGLHAAIHTQCRRYTVTGQWRVHIDAAKPENRAPRAVEVACFRILQEALDNIERHANARAIWVALRQDASSVQLTIRDDGDGFDANSIAARPGQHIGLFGMEMRAKQAGGSLRIESAPGKGTAIEAVFEDQG